MTKYIVIVFTLLCCYLQAQNDSIKRRIDIDFVEFGWGINMRTKTPDLPGNSQIFLNTAKRNYPVFNSPGLHYFIKNKIGIGGNIGFMFYGSNKKELGKEFEKVETDYYKQLYKDVSGPAHIFFRLIISRNYEVRKLLRVVPYIAFFYGAGNSGMDNSSGYKQHEGNIYFQREYRFNNMRMMGSDLGAAFKIKESLSSDGKYFAGILIKLYLTYYSFNGIASYKDTDFQKNILSQGQSRFNQNNFNLGFSGLFYFSHKKRNKRIRVHL